MATLSDANLSLLLQEVPDAPSISTLNGSPDPALAKALWTSLTFYQWTPTVRQSVDAGLQAAMLRSCVPHIASAAARTRDAMMADPDFYPFCLSPQYWPDAQRAHFRGLVGATTYQPPSYWGAVGREVGKVVIPTLLAAGFVALLPEEAIGGAVAAAAVRIGGKELAAGTAKLAGKVVGGTALAGVGEGLASVTSGPSPGDAAHEKEMWRRYQLEAQRRAIP